MERAIYRNSSAMIVEMGQYLGVSVILSNNNISQSHYLPTRLSNNPYLFTFTFLKQYLKK